MWKTLEERNLAIIKTVMLELGVADIEELPAKVIELKAAAQLRLQSDVKREPTIITEFPMRNAYPVGHKPKRRR